jgi:hypothetical protein
MPTRHTSVLLDNCQHENGHFSIVQQPLSPHDSFVNPALQPFLPSTGTPAQAGLPYFKSVLQQIDALGWDKASLSADLSLVVLQVRDAAGRCHRAEVQLPSGFPIAAPVVTIQLPGRLAARWLPGDSLANLADQIQKVRQQMHDLETVLLIVTLPVECAASSKLCLSLACACEHTVQLNLQHTVYLCVTIPRP